MANLCQEGDSMSRNQFELIGMRELERTIRQIGELPQKTVAKAARSAMRIALNSAKQHAPFETGNLKRGLILIPERSRVRGKKVYQVSFSSSMNDVFVKISESDNRSYYPASQEYGFLTKNGRYIPGFRYLRKSIDSNKSAIEQKVISVFTQEFDRLR